MMLGAWPRWTLVAGLAVGLTLTGCASAAGTPAPTDQPELASPPVPVAETEPSTSEEDLSPRERLARKKAEQRATMADEPLVELPLEQLRSGHLIAPMVIGGEELIFILDTGASTSVVTPATQARLGWKDEDGTPVSAQGANGEVADVRVFSVDEATMGPRTYKDLGVAVMDLAHLEAKLDRNIAGILGRNFLSRHELEVDFAHDTVRLHPPGSVAAGTVDLDGLHAVPYQSFRAGLIRIDVGLDGSDPFPAVLDLGAARSVVNVRAAEAAGKRRGKGLRKAPEALLGADGRPLPALIGTFDAITVGEATFEDPELHVADLGVFATLEIDQGPAMVMGLDLMRGRRLIIDYSGQQLFVSSGRPEVQKPQAGTASPSSAGD